MKTKIVKLGKYYVVGKSTATATYHKMLGPRATVCNSGGSRNGISVRIASAESFEKASDSSFCEKCFPNGKPSEYTIENI